MAEAPPLPQPPFFLIPNVNNLRDPALFPGSLVTTSPPGTVRSGILFRSAEVSKLDRGGWGEVRGIGVGRVFDLRSKAEVDKGWVGDMEGVGVGRVWVPVFEEGDYSPERLAGRYGKYMEEGVEGFVHAYKDILQHAGPSFRTILLYLADLPPPSSPPTPSLAPPTSLSNNHSDSIPPTQDSRAPLGALIHCTAGKDRTGIFFGLLFSFLGVDPKTIAAEYNLTEKGLACIREEVVARLMSNSAFKKYIIAQSDGKTVSTAELAALFRKQQDDEARGGRGAVTIDAEGGEVIPKEVLEMGRRAALRMVGASKESMVASLRMLDSEYGGAEGYMRSVCGLGDEELQRLRRNLVVRGV